MNQPNLYNSYHEEGVDPLRNNLSSAITLVAVFLIIIFHPLLPYATENKMNVFFLHHSVGDSLIRDGSVRTILSDAGFEFWDHERNNEKYGLRNERGEPAGCYWIPDDNTYPVGLAKLFSMDQSEDNALTRILYNHDVIIIKSCFPANNLKKDNAALDAENSKRRTIHNYKRHYLAIRKTIDNYPNKIFIIVTSPPLHPNVTDRETAERAMFFVKWIQSEEFIGKRNNLFVFDYFSLLADKNSHTLKKEYQIDPKGNNSHPNPLAQMNIGPRFADFIINIAKYGKSNALSGVYFNNAIRPAKLKRLQKPLVNLSGKITSSKNTRKIVWTNLSGQTGHMEPKDSWELKGIKIKPGVTTFIVTAIDNNGLRSSAVFGVQYYSENDREIFIFSESGGAGVNIFGTNVKKEPGTSGSGLQKIVVTGIGGRKYFGLRDIEVDISDFDPQRTFLEISYDQGTDRDKPRLFLEGIGSYELNSDSKHGLEKIIIPFNRYQYVTNRLDKFVIRGKWDKSTKVIIESMRLFCHGQ